jgi:hypothetical protein
MLDEAIAAFQRMPVPDRPSDADVLARLGPVPKKGRHLLRLVVPPAAAAVLFVGGLGLLLLHGTAPLALADVVKAAGKHRLVRYQQQQITDTKEHGCTRVDSVIYADLTAPRLRSESRLDDADGRGIRLSIHDAHRHLITDSRRKTAWLGGAPEGYKSLLCCLEEFQQKEGVAQVPDRLGTLATIKHHLQEQHQTTLLWSDLNTKLPVRMEQEFIDPTPDVSRKKLVWTDFAWDPEVPGGFRDVQELFSTRPPDGYTLDDQTKEKKDK